MIALLLTLSLTIPCQLTQVGPGQHLPAAPADVTIRGTVELSPAAADTAAMSLATERVRELALTEATGLVDRAAPFWLPSFTREQIVRRWLGQFDPAQGVRVLERSVDAHDHGGLGTSYRTTLRVASDERALDAAMARLRRAVPRAAEFFAIKCAGVIGFWLVLGVVLAWIDRLSRGYMTWRLRAIGAIAGVTLPAVVLLIL